MVAAARAGETDNPDPLIRDPYARILVEGAGTGMWESMLDESMADRVEAADPEAAAIFRHMGNYQAVRTHFFDAFFADAAAAGIRQIVILASGLDSRAYRLDWPAGTRVYEIDQPGSSNTRPPHWPSTACAPPRRCTRCPWTCARTGPPRCAGEGSTPRTDRLAGRGLLMYLPADARDRLFEQVTELSAPGSRVSAEAVAHRDEKQARGDAGAVREVRRPTRLRPPDRHR